MHETGGKPITVNVLLFDQPAALINPAIESHFHLSSEVDATLVYCPIKIFVLAFLIQCAKEFVATEFGAIRPI